MVVLRTAAWIVPPDPAHLGWWRCRHSWRVNLFPEPLWCSINLFYCVLHEDRHKVQGTYGVHSVQVSLVSGCTV